MDNGVPLGDEAQQKAAVEALSGWLPNATVYYTEMPQGSSGAQLIGVDISGNTGEFPVGGYILRVGPSDDRLTQRNERAASDLLRGADREFAKVHIPRLLRTETIGEGEDSLVVSLHQLAGGSLGRYVAPHIRTTGLLASARRVAKGVLTAWAEPSDMRVMAPYELLVELVGTDRAQECLEAVRHFFGDSTYNDECGYPVRNPLDVLGPGRGSAVQVMWGCCHGDLHNRNLLIPRDERVDVDSAYWIVDTVRAHKGAAGFDVAYLEVGVLVNLMQDIRLQVLHRCLTSIEDVVSRSVPDGTDWLMGFLKESRAGIEEWISEQTGRVDLLVRQIMLLRVIVGLLWARRFPPGSHRAKMCLVYAGWYAKSYAEATADDGPVLATPPSEDEERRRKEAQDELWASVWESVSGFSAGAAHYILIAERMPGSPSVAALGRVPWSLIIDLDPRSDHDGLHHLAGPVLESQRAIHLFTRDQLPTDFSRGTAWTLAVGSVRRNEPADDLRTWGYRRLNGIRQLVSSLHRDVGDTTVHVIVLEGEGRGGFGTERERLLRVIDAVDEALQGRGTFLHVGPFAPTAAAELNTVALPVQAFLDRLAETHGTTPDEVEYTVPAADQGTAALLPETMQKLREHLIVLHDGIELAAQPTDGRNNDEFWRGGLISWADLDQRRDLRRTVTSSLVAALREGLEEHRTRTVLLQHKPGTGGTTVALRAAWELHHEYPVAVLPHGVTVDRIRVPLIADRLNLLHTTTQKPVLLVAESGDLSESDREALYQELGKRGTQTTLLYVRRGVGGSNSGALVVDEFLNTEEADDFLRRYSALVDEKSRIRELKQLSRKTYEQFRTPFFYGLITFERKFTKLSDYVSSHLEGVKGRAAEVMKYLALVTIYANTGLQEETVRKLMRAPSLAGLALDDILGPGAARLTVVRAGRVRLQHQLIAEQVLACLYRDEDWRYELKDLAIDFIEALTHTTDVSFEPVRVLLQQMFVIRQGSFTVDDTDDEERGDFSPLIESLAVDPAHQVLSALTHYIPKEPHFWNHLGRHQMYRIGKDLDKADEYVSRAVDLAEDSFIHHHTSGLVRKAILRQELTRKKSHGVAAVMDVIEERFEWTVGGFNRSRQLNKENLYAYITHVQTIILAARTLKAAARVRSVAELDSAAGEWVVRQVGEANELLEEATRVHGTLDVQDRFVVECRTGIDQLYNDLNAVVGQWEIAATGGRTNSMVQRALAQAYYARAGRRWRNLELDELRRIAELARQNLSRRDSRAEDYRLWFEASKHLPEFDADVALSQLDGWLDRLSTWRGHYYRYCLLFDLWFKGLNNDTAEFREAQRTSRDLVSARPKQSYLWFAKKPGGYTLISDGDLGEWDRKKNFWKNPEPLRRVNGRIDVIHTQWSGHIRLDGSVTAFFKPKPAGVLPGSDAEKPVNFFLGLSPDGLQAWDVRRGHLPDAVSARSTVGKELPDLVPAEPGRETALLSPSELATQAAEIRDEQRIEFLLALLGAWQEVGQAPRLSTLTERLSARYRHSIDTRTVEDLLDRTGRTTYSGGDDPDVLLLDATRRRTAAPTKASVPASLTASRSGRRVLGRILQVPDATRSGMAVYGGGASLASLCLDDIEETDALPPQRGQLLWLDPVEQRGQTIAMNVRLLPLDSTAFENEVVPADELRNRLESDLRDQMDVWTSQGRESVAEDEVTEWLEQRFAGATPLGDRLGVGRLSAFWGELHWLRCRHKDDGRFLSLETEAVFGRVGFLNRPAASARPRPDGTPASFAEALAEVVDDLRKRHGNDPTFAMVDKALRARLKGGYRKIVGPDGGRSLNRRIKMEPGWEVVNERDRPGRVCRTTGTARQPLPADAPGAEPASSREAVLAQAVRTMRDQGKEPQLAELGKVLRVHLGDDFASVVGRSLTAWVNSVPGWEVEEPRPGYRVARRRDRFQPLPDVAAELAEVLDVLSAEGREAIVTNVGNLLVDRWGLETYRAVTQGKGIRTLAARHGFEAYEPRPGVWCLRLGGVDRENANEA
ncbi:hypothetical protein [Streptomyces sp. NPDC001980]|uniref:P-loop NTPase n=1 Tax=Streptomyces sp. NPDC001980 TaxID=3157126 RepID=UPI003327773B